MTKHAPRGDICAMRVQNLDFVVVTEAHGFQVNTSDYFDYTIHEEHIPLDDFETLDAPSPDCRVPDPNVFRSFDEPVGHGAVVEVDRWARFCVESATLSLNLCCMQRNLRAVVPFREVGEPISEEG